MLQFLKFCNCDFLQSLNLRSYYTIIEKLDFLMTISKTRDGGGVLKKRLYTLVNAG